MISIEFDYMARPKIETEDSPAQHVKLVVVTDAMRNHSVGIVEVDDPDKHFYPLEDWVILEKVERK